MDWENATVPAEACGGTGEMTLEDGYTFVNSGDDFSEFGVWIVGVSLGEAVYGDLDGDGDDEAVVSIWCDNGGGTADGQLADRLVVIDGDASSYHSLGILTTQVPRQPNVHVTYFHDGATKVGEHRIKVQEIFYGQRDGTCCPTGEATTEWTWSDGHFSAKRPKITKEPDGAEEDRAPPPTDDVLVGAAFGCGDGCKVFDRLDDLPSPDGPATLAVVSHDLAGGFARLFFVVVAESGKVVWTSVHGKDAYVSGPDRPYIHEDASGNVIANYAVGAHSGYVVTLRITPDGVDDLGSLEHDRFFSSSPPLLVDTNEDGVEEIVTRDSDYDPSYADGTNYDTTYRWNGDDYVAVACTSQRSREPSHDYPPRNGACWSKPTTTTAP